jgi:hypothetical protein
MFILRPEPGYLAWDAVPINLQTAKARDTRRGCADGILSCHE